MIGTCGFRPPAIQRSKSAVKSAVVTAGGGPGQAHSLTLAHTLCLTRLAHEGEAWEVGGREEM